MNNTNESIGLRVLTVSPEHKSKNINVNSEIKIEFSADINPGTFAKNIVVLKDYNKIYKDINSLKDYSQYSVVKGSISYNDRILVYTPNEPFSTDTCYIIMLSDNITDITGSKMIRKHVSCFYTEAVASFPRVEIMSPKFGAITNEIPEITWKNQFSASYTMQVSKANTFELLLYDKEIPGSLIGETVTHKPEFKMEEGLYYLRIKSENGEWSDTHQFFIKAITDAVIAEEDIPDIMNYEEFMENLEEPIEILEMFPENGSVNNTLKTNVIYIKIKGKVNEERINLNDSYVFGSTIDEEHPENTHDLVDGKWTLIYDSYYDVTYVIFTPEIIDEKEDLEYIETVRSGNLVAKKGTATP